MNKKIKLTDEETELLNSIENNEWNTTNDYKNDIIKAQSAAGNYLRKDERITLRISSGDLSLLKQRAAYKGLPYQTFIASVLHEYAAGHFAETSFPNRPSAPELAP